MRTLLTKAKRRTGSAIVEFTLVGSFVFLPMLAGLATVGMSMVVSLQVANLNANAGQMFSYGVDFSQAANVDMLNKVGGNLNITDPGGKGVLILSQIAGPVAPGTIPTCANQIIIGNSANGASKYAPSCALGGSFALMPAMVEGQVAYLAETYFDNSQYAWAFAPRGTGTGIYVKALY